AILRAALATLHPGWQHLLAAALPGLTELVTAIDNLADQGPQPAGPAVQARRDGVFETGTTPGAADRS
ncbi:MAG: hypothetical protein ACM3ML_32145, partial [Micromonosporaceae bacterium]